MDTDWLLNIVISAALVAGSLFLLLYTMMLLRDAEQQAAPRAPRPLERSDPRARQAPPQVERGRERSPQPGRGSARASGQGEGVIISGFDTGGSRLLVRVAGEAIRRRKRGVTFGRDPNIAEFTIVDDGGSLSRRHFRIFARDGGRLEIEDLGSVAGTKLEGAALKPFEPRPLPLPAKLEVGRTVLDVRAGSEGDAGAQISSAMIGRHPECDIVLGDESISRLHAELIVSRNRRFFLVDRQSTRGTWLYQSGWKRLDRGEYVQEDQRVRLGDHETTVSELARRL